MLEEEVLKELKLLVGRYRRANLFVVVAFRTGPGRNEAVFGGEEEAPVTEVWTSETARKAWVEMWKEASVALRDESNVVGYDLMVEPIQDSEKVSDADENRRRYKTWYDLASEIAGAIRGNNDETPILIGGANASSACALQCLPPINLPNIVYTAHQYEPYTYTHQAVGEEGKEEPQGSNYNCSSLKSTSPTPKRVGRPRRVKERLERIYGMLNGFRRSRANAPVAVNEFGVFRWAPKASEHLRDEMELMERLGANYALWLWEPQTTCVGYDEFDFRHGTDFSSHREDLRNSLAKAVARNWKRNIVFPDTVTFRPSPRR